MTTDGSFDAPLRGKKALLIGLGGLGCPAALALARSPGVELILVDDDTVDESNLARQILYGEADVGTHKLDAAAARLRAAGAEVSIRRTRFLPENARALAREADVIVEGADNFATKFLAADAGHLEERPVVHGAGVRWHGTAWLVEPGGAPCYRCVFEDVLPSDVAPNCAEAGVIGPVVGYLGALMADLALDALRGDFSRAGAIHSFDGRRMTVRPARLGKRDDCPLCGRMPKILELSEELYFEPSCSAPSRRATAANHPPSQLT